MIHSSAPLAHPYWHGGGWFWLWPLVPLGWVLVVLFVVWLIVRGRPRGPWATHWSPPGPDPRAILAERYARGEISHDEYRERLSHLAP
jgi:putative membrane protein